MKILFVIPGLGHGGTNKVLENLLPLLDKDRYDISILTLNGESENEVYLDVFSKSGFIYRLPDLISGILFSCIGNKYVLALNYSLKKYLRWTLFERFFLRRAAKTIETIIRPDVAIAFEERRPTIMVSNFECKKIAWVQCDYKSSYIGEMFPVLKEEHRCYKYFNKIVCVSKYTTKSFLDVFPDLDGKVVHINNPLNKEQLLLLSSENINDKRFKTDVFTIISVGRYTQVKQFHLIPDIINKVRLLSPNMVFRWYIIGDGDIVLMEETRNKIADYKIENKLILLGSKNNPYPFMKRSNLYICTSYSESFSYVIREAKALGVPVLSNSFPSAIEAIKDNKEGILSCIEEMPQVIIDLINNRNNCYTNIREVDYHDDNNLIKQQIEQLI